MPNADPTKGSLGSIRRPTDAFSAMRDELDRVFERFEDGWPRWSNIARRGFEQDGMVPELDVHDNAKQLTIEIDLPGVEEKDISVTLANGVLTIKGRKKTEREEKRDNYYMAERSYGAFERTLRMPDTIDENKVEAKFDKG